LAKDSEEGTAEARGFFSPLTPEEEPVQMEGR